MEFKEVKTDKYFRLLNPQPTILCTSKLGEKSNIITLAWNMVVSRDPPIVAISVAPQRFSHKLIKESQEFTINVPTKEIIKEVYYCGSHSGKILDKFKNTSLTPLDGIKVKCPRIKECVSHLECKVIDSKKYGDHTLFIGEVLTCVARTDLILGGELNFEKIEVPYHLGARNFTFNKKEIYSV